jgi:hypothetical protein
MQREKREDDMEADGDRIRDLVRGLDGLVLLAQWQMAVARDVRAKAAALLAPEEGAAEADEPPELGKRPF